MTANQIAYMKMREEQRSNLAKEQETYRANRAAEEERFRADNLDYEARNYATRVNELNNIRSTSAQQYSAQLQYAANMAATNVRQQEVNVAQTRAAEEARHNVINELQNDYANRTRNELTRQGNWLNAAVGVLKLVS